MTSMVERVARALHEELAGGDPDEMIHHPAQSSWEAPTRKRWEQWEEAARAAIEAMREPTDAMVDVGEMTANDMSQPDWSPTNIASRTFAAMIQAALNEQVSG